MAGNILLRARRDAQKIVKGEFSEDVLFLTKNLSKFALLKGTHSKHWQKFNTDGSIVNAKNAHITLSEEDLLANGFVIRNSSGNVALRDHFCMVKDSSGEWKKYGILEVYPNETLGLIVMILKDADFNLTEEQWRLLD